MALVAYASSDESDIEDGVDVSEIPLPPVETLPTQPIRLNGDDSACDKIGSEPLPDSVDSLSPTVNDTNALNDLIDDDAYDDYENAPIVSQLPQVTVNYLSLHLPPPKSISAVPSQSLGLLSASKSTDDSAKTKSLYVPLLDDDVDIMPGTTSNAALSDLTFDDELEESVKPKFYEKDAPKPSKRQPVKIVIPDLPDVDSDSDDEAAPKSKKPKTAGKSALFNLLPAPKNATLKEAGRPLLPLVMSRKPKQTVADDTPKSVPLPAVKSAAPIVKPDLEESDEEDEPIGSFFSVGAQPSSKSDIVITTVCASTLTYKSVVESEPILRGPWKGPSGTSTHALETITELKPNKDTSFEESPPSIEQQVNILENDAPLDFHCKETPYARPSYNFSSSAASDNVVYDTWAPEDTETNRGDTGMSHFANDESFLRIQGRKGHRQEEINFIDVNADDALNPADLIKNLTEETSMTSHSKKRNDLPSSQQRRKHQITYLAHEAKEREFELKNSWATNRQTKRETQAKYGF